MKLLRRVIISSWFYFSMNNNNNHNNNKKKSLMRICNGEVRSRSIASYSLVMGAMVTENNKPAINMNQPLIMESISALSYRGFRKNYSLM